MKNKDIFNEKRILIVNVNWIGDVLFSTPAIKLVRQYYPSAFLACMVVERCAEILKNNPYIDELIFFDERDANSSFFSKAKFIVSLRKKKFDMVFIFHRSFTRALICKLAGIPRRIGYDRKKRNFLLTDKKEINANEIHRVDYFLSLLAIRGLKAADREYQFFINEKDGHFAQEFLKENAVNKGDLLVALNPGGNWALKRWPWENFALLGDLIAEKYNAKILISGARKDVELAGNIAGAMKYKPVIAAGRTTLSGLAALYQCSRLVISADSGPMHIAASMKVPVIALFGPTSPKITGPITSSKTKIIQQDVGCEIPCYRLDCRMNKCMQAITPDAVMRVIEKEEFLKFNK